MSPRLCPNQDGHTPHPAGYVAYAEWAERMLKTHHQEKCPACGRWAIWMPGKPKESA